MTLDGFVKQMRSGDVDLRRSVLVGSSQALADSQNFPAIAEATAAAAAMNGQMWGR